jgi:hypothetical protein
MAPWVRELRTITPSMGASFYRGAQMSDTKSKFQMHHLTTCDKNLTKNLKGLELVKCC